MTNRETALVVRDQLARIDWQTRPLDEIAAMLFEASNRVRDAADVELIDILTAPELDAVA